MNWLAAGVMFFGIATVSAWAVFWLSVVVKSFHSPWWPLIVVVAVSIGVGLPCALLFGMDQSEK